VDAPHQAPAAEVFGHQLAQDAPLVLGQRLLLQLAEEDVLLLAMVAGVGIGPEEVHGLVDERLSGRLPDSMAHTSRSTRRMSRSMSRCSCMSGPMGCMRSSFFPNISCIGGPDNDGKEKREAAGPLWLEGDHFLAEAAAWPQGGVVAGEAQPGAARARVRPWAAR
jgi:hypothetical protein